MAAMPFPVRRPDRLALLAGAGSVLYPFVVYFGLPYLPPGPLVAMAVALGALHLLRQRGGGLMPRWSILAIPSVLLALLVLRPVLAAQAYPPLVSLCLAATFAWSLSHPPTAIERLARLTIPDLPPDGVAYTRTVTKVWTVFFLANASIACVCAVWFPVAIWTLWTGLVSYLCIGLLIVGEVAVRRWRTQRAAP